MPLVRPLVSPRAGATLLPAKRNYSQGVPVASHHNSPHSADPRCASCLRPVGRLVASGIASPTLARSSDMQGVAQRPAAGRAGAWQPAGCMARARAAAVAAAAAPHAGSHAPEPRPSPAAEELSRRSLLGAAAAVASCSLLLPAAPAGEPAPSPCCPRCVSVLSPRPPRRRAGGRKPLASPTWRAAPPRRRSAGHHRGAHPGPHGPQRRRLPDLHAPGGQVGRPRRGLER